MLFRKPLPLRFSASLFAIAVSMIPLASQLGRRPVSTPRTLAELTERLSGCTLPLYVVAEFPDKPECPIWVCTRPQTREQLGEGLRRDPERVRKGLWQGIVYCERVSELWLIEDEFIRVNWGKYGMRIGPFVLFGDPELLERLREAIIN